MSVGKLRTCSGFTLIELMVILAVAIIIATIALPNFSQLRDQQEIVASTNDVIGALQSARREAINRRLGMTVVLGGSSGWPLEVKYTDPGTGNEVTALRRQSSYNAISISWDSGSELVFNRFGRVGAIRSLCILRDEEVLREINIRISGQIEKPRKGGEIENCT